MVAFEPYARQQEFIDAVFSKKFSICGYGGAMGGGKTYVCLAVLVLLHRLYPNTKSVVIRESLPTLQKTTIPSFKKLLPSTVYQWNGMDFKASFANGSEIMFMSENISHDPDGNRFKGLEVNFTFLEQLEELQQSTLEIMKIRTGRHRVTPMPKPLILYSLNPSNNWVKEYTWDRYKKKTLPDDHFYLPAFITDNPALSGDSDYMNQFHNLDKLTYQRYIQGDWDAFGAQMPWAYAFSEVRHTGFTEMNITEPLYISFDFNHAPCTCTIWQHYENKIRCLYELGSNNGLVDLCRQIRELVGVESGELIRQVFVTGDKSGWNKSELLEGNRTAYDIIQAELNISKYAIQAPKTNPNHLKARELTNSLFEKHPDILLDKNHCPNFIFDLKFCESDEKHEIIKDRNKQQGKADYLDSGKYYFNTYHSNFVRL